MIPLVAIVAALAMLLDDIFYACVTLFEASGKSWLAGLCDMLGYYAGITTTTVAVTTLSGHSLLAKAWVLLFVGAANVLGTALGAETGKFLLRRLHTDTVETLAARVARLENVIMPPAARRRRTARKG